MCKLSTDHRQQNYYYHFNSWRPQGEDKEKKVRFNQKKRLLRKLRKQSKSSTSKLSFWLKIMCQANIKLHSWSWSLKKGFLHGLLFQHREWREGREGREGGEGGEGRART